MFDYMGERRYILGELTGISKSARCVLLIRKILLEYGYK